MLHGPSCESDLLFLLVLPVDVRLSESDRLTVFYSVLMWRTYSPFSQTVWLLHAVFLNSLKQMPKIKCELSPLCRSTAQVQCNIFYMGIRGCNVPMVHSQTVGKRWTSWLCSCVLCNHQQEATLVIIRYLYKNLLGKQPFSSFPDGFITSDHSFTSY